MKLELETCQKQSNKNWQNTKSARWRENLQGCQKQILGTIFQRILQQGQPLCCEKAWELFKIFQYFNIFQGMGAVQNMPNQRRWKMFKCSMFKICQDGSCENLQLEFLPPAVGSKALREIFSVDSSLAGLKSFGNLAIIGQSNNQLSWQTFNKKMVTNEFCLWVDG